MRCHGGVEVGHLGVDGRGLRPLGRRRGHRRDAAGLGSAFYGAGRPYDDFIMITLGTGVGGAIIYKNRVFRGSTGGAGEIGHMTIDYEGPFARSGVAGAIEAARVLSKHEFPGTIVYAGLAGEEQGLLGGRNDRRRCIVRRLAHRQIDNFFALPPHLLNELGKVHCTGRFNLVDAI